MGVSFPDLPHLMQGLWGSPDHFGVTFTELQFRVLLLCLSRKAWLGECTLVREAGLWCVLGGRSVRVGGTVAPRSVPSWFWDSASP